MKTTLRNFKLFLLGAILALPFLNKWDGTAKAQADTWTYKASFAGTGRNYGVGFAVGAKGYMGLGVDGAINQNDMWEYDPAANSWTQKANVPGGGSGGRNYATAFAIGTKGYVGTGGNFMNDFYEFDPVANTWTAKANYPVGIYGAVSFVIGNKGYVGTGQDASTFYNTFYEFDPVGNTWTAKASFGGVGRRFATAFSIGNKGYVGSGGGSAAPGMYSDFWEYSQVSDTWVQIASIPGIPGAGTFFLASAFSTATKGYVCGGWNSTCFNNVSEYDPTTGNWTAKTPLPSARRTAPAFFIGTKGYLCTGNTNTTQYITDLLEYSTCAPSPSVSQGSYLFCNAGTVTLQATGADTYTWSHGASNGSVVTPTVSTIYTVSASSATCPGVTYFTTVNVTIDSPTIAVTASSATICAGSSVALTTSTFDNNLVAYYPFNEGSGTTVADASGNNLNGGLFNSPTWSTSTAPLTGAGSNLSFNPGYVNVPDNALFNTMQNHFSIEAWIYTTAGNVATIIDRANYNFLFQANDNGQKLGFYNPSGGWSYSNSNVPINQWSHVAITYNGSTLTFYLNGVADGTAARSNLTFNSGPVNIGRQEPNGCQCNIFTGKIDEVRLWNSVRTAGQLLASSTTTLAGWASYTWTPSGSLSAGNTVSVIATPGTSTIYSLSATDSNGCSTSTVTSISVTSAPALAISGNSMICNGSSTTLTALGNANTYAWNSSGAPVDNISSTALAVGLRQLRTAYTGNAIRLRRASDNVEQDFGFVSTGDLDVASINTFLGGSIGYCTTMYDQSGNGRNVTQTSTGNQPTFTVSGINSKPSLHFTTSQYMTNTTNFPSPFTAIYTARQTGPTRARMLGATGNNWLLGWWGGNKNMAYLSGWVNQATTAGDNGLYVYTGASDGSTSSFYGNGTLIASNNGGTTGPSGIELNGYSNGGETSEGDFTEVFVFNTVLSNTNRQIVENNTGGYYGAFGSSIVTGSVNVATPSVTTVYTLTGTSANGCSSSVTQNIIVNASPTIAANSSNICSGSGAVLTASGAATYSWSNGIANGGGVTPTITTSYTVTGTTGGCSTTATVTVTVKAAPVNQAITAALTSICGGSGSTTINSASSEVGVNYYLRDNSTNSVVTGPLAGTGSGLSFTTGIISSTKTFNVLASKSASALAFASGYVSVPQSSVFNYSTNVDFTYEAWINCTASQPDYSGIVVKAGGGPFVQMVLVGNKIAAEFSGTSLIGVGQGLQGTTNLNNGVWHHVAMVVTRATNNIKLYVDGVVEANVTNSQVSANINDNMATYFGADRNTGNHFNGMIDEVRIWNTAKTQAQLVTNASSCYTGSEPNLLAYYQFENGSGSSTVTDLTSNHNNGTLTGMNAVTSWTISGVTNCNCSIQMANTPTVGLSSGVAPTVNNPTICAGASVAIVPSGTGPYTITGGTFTVTPSSTTSYTITDTGACNGTVVATVSVNTSPTISVNSATICSGNSVAITPTGAGVSTFTITGGSFSVSPVTTTSYSVTGTGTNGCAASNTAVATVSVNTTPSITVNSATICSGNSVVITPTGAGVSTFTITGGSFSVSPVITTSYSVTGTGTNGCAASNTAVATVSVNTTPSITVNSATICSGNSVAIAPTGAGVSTFTITGGSFSVSPVITTSYSVTGTGTNGCVASNTAVATVSVNTTPSITVNNATICSGNSVAITPTGAGVSTFTITGGSFSVSPVTTTSYSVTGTGTNGCAASNTAVATVSVNTTPGITVNSATICAGNSVVITPTAPGITAFTITGGNFTVSPGTTTSYSVTGTGTNGCASSNTAIATVSVNVIPSVSITPTPTAICTGFSGTLTASGASTYSWNTTQTTTSIVVNPTVSTNYTLNGTSNGCTGSTTFSLIVNTATVGITASNTLLCSGQSATLSASNTGNYLWNTSSTTSSIVVSPTATTTYSVTRTSTLTGCSGTAAITVSVNTTPTITANNATICSGASVTITPTGAGTGATYSIQGGTFTVTPNTTASYSVIGTSTNGCVSNSIISTVSVNTTPSITVNSATICSGSPVVISPTGAGTGATYSIQGGTFNVSPTITATYSVAGTGTNGCVSQSVAATVSVNTTPTLSANSGAICPGNIFTITPTGNAGGTYTISGGSFTVQPSVTTSYTVTGTGAGSCAAIQAVATVSVVNTLTVSISGATTVCNGSALTLTATGASNYTWTPGTVTTATAAFSPTTNTTYSVIGASGTCTNTAVLSVTVLTTPTITVNSATICSNSSVVIAPAGAGIGATYSIQGGTFNVSPTINATYSVTGTGTNGCVSQSVAATVSVNTTPTLAINSGSICSGKQFTLVPSGNASGTYTITGATFTVSPTVTTAYTLTGTGTGSCAAFNTVVTTVSVSATPTITVNSATICSGASVVIAPTGAGTGATYSIQGGTLTVTPNTTTSYSVIGTSTSGCVSTSVAATVSVNTTPSITVNSATICSNSSVVIAPTGAGTGATYSIQGGTFNVSPTITATYSVTGTGTNGCVSTSVAATVSVNTTPTLSANSGAICPGNAFTITPTGNAGGTYTISGGSYTVQPSTTTSYTLTGTGAGSCAAIQAVATVSVVNTLTVAISGPTTVCNGSAVTLTATGASNYTWTPGTVTTATAAFSPTTTTTYSVLGASGTCSNTAVLTVSVNATPTITANSATICSGNAATITPTGAGIGATYNVTGNNFTVSPAITTTYSVVGTSTNGCVSNSIVSTVSVNTTPTLSVNSATICSNSSVVITPTGSAASYSITGNTFSVTPLATTNYSVTGTGANGCVSSAAISTITVKTTPTITAANLAMCSGRSATVVPTGAGTGATYTIQGGNFTVTPTANTSYSVIGTNTNGCVSGSIAVTVSVNTTPSITVNSASICAGSSVIIAPTGAGTGATYTVQGNSFTVTPSANTNYSVTGTGTNGCVSSVAIATITVNANPTLTVNGAVICSGSPVVITPSGTITYTISGNSFTVSPTTSTDYSVSGTDANGCLSNEAISSITVNATPSITVNSPSMCAGGSAVILPSGADTYTISGGSFTVSPASGASYSVSGTSTAGCVSTEVISSVVVNALPSLTAATSAATICINETVNLTVSGANTYSWSTAQTGTLIASTPIVAGTVVYTVTGTDANGCMNTATVAQSADLCTGISKQSVSSVNMQVYPNPNNGQFIIVAAGNISISVMNTVGQLVYSTTTTAETTSINIGHLANGIYFVKAVNGSSQQTIKLIKE